MIYKPFQDTALSRLGLGNMRLPVQSDVPGTPIDREKAGEIIDLAMASGINYYDTAYLYHGGESESFVGEKLVSRYPRDSFRVATKFPIHVNPDYRAVFEEQLRRLKTDYVDFYLIHAVMDSTVDTLFESGALEYFLEQKRLGRIKYFGFSCHASPENTERFAAHHDWDFAQLQINYFDWEYGKARGQYEALARHNIPVMVMEPVRGGRLAKLSPDAEAMLRAAHPDWTTASWAMRWVWRLPLVQVVLSGMSDLEQVKDNCATFSDGAPLSDEDAETLKKACALFKEQVQVPCTACRYCCDDCPARINIPEVLKVYNQYKVDGPDALHALRRVDSEGKPADCVACGSCARHCPQGIDIPAIMRELKERK